MIIKLVLLFALFSPQSFAAIGRMITVQGHIVKIDPKISIIKDDKGTMKVPTQSVDTEHYKVGAWVNVTVDLAEFFRLNPEKFAK